MNNQLPHEKMFDPINNGKMQIKTKNAKVILFCFLPTKFFLHSFNKYFLNNY